MNKPNFEGIDFPQGTVIQVQGGKDGLTELERKAKAGQLDPKELIGAAPPELKSRIKKEAEEFAAKREQEMIKEMMGRKPSVNTTPTSFDRLSPEEQAKVADTLKGMSVPEELVPKTTTQFKLPRDITADMKSEDEHATKTGSLSSQREVCKCCGWEAGKDIDPVTEEDKANYLRSIVGHSHFFKDYKIMGGRLTVRFRSRSMKEQQLISDQLKTESTNGVIPKDPVHFSVAAYNGRLRRLNMGASIVHISGMKNELPSIASEEGTKLYKKGVNSASNIAAAALNMIVEDWDESLFAIIFKQFQIFDDLCWRLAEAAASPSFWEKPGDSI